MSGYDSGGDNLYVLYKIVNVESDRDDEHFNAFVMPRTGGPNSRGPSLAAVKQRCAALHGLNHLGPDGYHWRVCVEDKPAPGEAGSSKTYSWWDIQDENATLPIKTASQYNLHKFFSTSPSGGSSSESSVGDDVAKVAKGAFKSLGKAVTQAVAGHDHSNGPSSDAGPMVSVIAFKLLDLVKMHDDFSTKNHGRGGHIPQPAPAQHHNHRPSSAAPHSQPRQQAQRAVPTPAQPPRSQHSQSAPPVRSSPPQQQRQQQQQPPPQARRPAAPAPEASLMDFGPSAPAPGQARPGLRHAQSSPLMGNSINPNESRAERLKREYAAKKQTSNRVWDDVDQRWVEVDPAAVAGDVRATQSAPPGAGSGAVPLAKKKEVGISLDPSNAVGKSTQVQAAVQARVSEMKQSQAKAVNEIREREAQKKAEEAEEDLVRKRLEPKLKAWSEEHGKKKQLRALLATLHTILWPGADWKPVGIGDLLDDSKVKRCFHKASRVVHPDKTHHLGPEQRFMAKRIFDALSQAKNDFDSGSK
jgi:hypothetical protein